MAGKTGKRDEKIKEMATGFIFVIQLHDGWNKQV
jgi:hypothetical protein